MVQSKEFRIAVLLSGNGSNLQALIDAIQQQKLDARIVVVIADRQAYGLKRAQQAGIATELIQRSSYVSKQAFEQTLAERLDQYQPDLIVLAGFMRILSSAFVSQYRRRIINIHPSLLPKYPGLNTHQRVLDHHETVHGCSVHFVTDQLDAGPVIAQATLSIRANDNATTLKQRVQQLEHQLYPQVVQWFARQRNQ